jgi:hypothetical protein
MTKDQVKKLVRYALPLLLAVGATYGYVDQSCTCSAPAETPAPAVESPDAGE